MGGHSHGSHEYDVTVGRGPRVVLLTALVLVAVATLLGLWKLWPDASEAPELPAAASYSAPGVTRPDAEVTRVQPPCPVLEVTTPDGAPDSGSEPSESCGHIDARLEDRSEVTVQVPPEVASSGLRPGDRVQLVRTPAAEGQPATYTDLSTDRHVPLFWLAGLFVVLVIAVARLRGLMALVTLAFSAWMIAEFMLPALLAGRSGEWVALVGASAIMFVVLYCTHGVSLRTSSALAGTLVGVAVMAFVGMRGAESSRLTGVADESGAFLGTFVTGLDFTSLLACGLIIAGLGVLNDVTITQSSAVWELRTARPDASRREIFTSAMRIGRDHIASTIYTITFAYTGASIVLLLLLSVYERPLLELMSQEGIAEEIVRTLAGGIGLVLAVPITTAIAAATASPTTS